MQRAVAELDDLPDREAAGLLASCCGSTGWVQAMVAARPFGSLPALLSAAERCWADLKPADWLEAFRHHPRIGEQAAAVPQRPESGGWSAAEQAGVGSAPDATRQALAELNRQYEARFGYIYIVSAAGKSAEELLAIARERLRNAPDVELLTAAREQQKITRLRLEKLLR